MKLYVIEKATNRIKIINSDGYAKFVDINQGLFDGVELYNVTEKSKDTRFKYDNIDPEDVYTITYSELLELLTSNNENK